jgi:acyl carrier protein
MSVNGTNTAILGRLCVLAAEQAALDPSSVTAESDFFADLNFDSLDAVEFVMKIEDEFKVSIDDQQAEKAHTPRQAYDMLAAALLANRPAHNK